MMDVALRGVGAVIPTSRRLRSVDLIFIRAKIPATQFAAIKFPFHPIRKKS